MYIAQVDLCTYTTNKNGVKMVETKFSQFDFIKAKTKKELEWFAKGFLSALGYKYSNPAIRLTIKCGVAPSETIEMTL